MRITNEQILKNLDKAYIAIKEDSLPPAIKVLYLHWSIYFQSSEFHRKLDTMLENDKPEQHLKLIKALYNINALYYSSEQITFFANSSLDKKQKQYLKTSITNKTEELTGTNKKQYSDKQRTHIDTQRQYNPEWRFLSKLPLIHQPKPIQSLISDNNLSHRESEKLSIKEWRNLASPQVYDLIVIELLNVECAKLLTDDERINIEDETNHSNLYHGEIKLKDILSTDSEAFKKLQQNTTSCQSQVCAET